MATPRAPKQRVLTTTETLTSFEAWKANLIYILSLDNTFAPYLEATWSTTKANAGRGFQNDAGVNGRTAAQKKIQLELMLGMIANYAPIISRNTIIKQSTSLASVWTMIKQHYHFQSTGSQFLDFSAIRRQPEERPEDLYQRLHTFVENALLTKDSSITHHDEAPTEDEELSPTLEGMIVLRWLELINKDLPRLVQQRYCTELRSRTLPSIRHEISLAIESLLDEINLNVETRALALSDRQRSKPKSRAHSATPRRSPRCPICSLTNRPANHFLSKCELLPEADRKYLTKARALSALEDEDECTDCDLEVDDSAQSVSTIRISKIAVESCPHIDVFYGTKSTRLTLDTGCTGNIIRLDIANELNIPIRPTKQRAIQADGATPLDVVGEVQVTLNRDSHDLLFHGLVSRTLDVPILAGTPFQSVNDVYARPNRKIVYVKDSAYPYATSPEGVQQVRLCSFDTLRSTCRASVYPGEYLDVCLPPSFHGAKEVAVESVTPWLDHNIHDAVGNKVRIQNNTDSVQVVKKHDHLCRVRPVITTDDIDTTTQKPLMIHTTKKDSDKSNLGLHSQPVSIDPSNIFNADQCSEIKDIHSTFDNVFGPVTTGYNGSFGPIQAVVNMGPTPPPQRRGRLPLYPAKNMQLLQEHLDILEEQGVLAKPETLGINVEYVNPTFLVKKSDGRFRTVTAFADIGRFAKPTPSLMPDVESTIRTIAQWKYIICTDMSSAYFQIPLCKDSMKYCGVVTPYRGVRVYTRCAMGMPGSETTLEEVMSRVLGSCMLEGYMAKVADDMYVGGNSIEDLLRNWRKVLDLLDKANLKLSAKKTIICPAKTVILGWLWEKGTLRPTTHRCSALSSCDPPSTVKGLRSFIGAFKALSRVIPGSAQFITPLDEAVGGRESKESITWSESLTESFRAAQKHLGEAKTITLPRTDDHLWLVTDGAVKYPGVGATLYVERNSRLLPAGFFSAKLKKHQIAWLPCEIEALAIASASKFFGAYIIQSAHQTVCLTDSKPCCQAYEKLCRGEFSTSPRVSTMLSTASRFHLSIRHLAGFKNLVADYESRNVPPCDNENCQVCCFVDRLQQISVCDLNVRDILDHRSPMPYVSRQAWLQIQKDCDDISTTVAYLTNGTRPNKKLTKMRDTKRYLRQCTVSSDGLLVVKRDTSLLGPREAIVVPRSAIDGLLVALHIKLNHPSAHQLSQVVARYYFALDMKTAIERLTQSCHTCVSLRSFPKHQREQSTSSPPAGIGRALAADVMRRAQQKILVVREAVTSFTSSMLIESETANCVRQALLQLLLPLVPLQGPPSVLRTDPAPCFQALEDDEVLASHNMTIEIGDHKNENKNPIAERAIQELEAEIKRVAPGGAPVTPTQLVIATATLNSRIRSRGLSSREMLFMRDQYTFSQINSVSDEVLIDEQHVDRIANHGPSMRSKNPRAQPRMAQILQKGDVVYLIDDGSKHRTRDRYLVASVDGLWCSLQKFSGSSLMKRLYRVKRTSCYKIPVSVPAYVPSTENTDLSDDDMVPDYNVLGSEGNVLGSDEATDMIMMDQAQEDALDNYQSPDGKVVNDIGNNATQLDQTVNQEASTDTTSIATERDKKAVRHSGRKRFPNSRYKDYVTSWT